MTMLSNITMNVLSQPEEDLAAGALAKDCCVMPSSCGDRSNPAIIANDDCDDMEEEDDKALELLLKDDSTTNSSSFGVRLNSSQSESNLLEAGNHHQISRVVSDDCGSPGVEPSLTRDDYQENNVIKTKAFSSLLKTVSPIVETSTEEKREKSILTNNKIQGTALFTFIQNNQYIEANKRVREFPEEASIWVALRPPAFASSSSPSKNKCIAPPRSSVSVIEPENFSNKKCLPIHLACSNLATASESKQRFQLEQLILKLILTFPAGCSLMDHNGQSPLLLAIWNSATPETISMLLMADPSSMYHKDTCGRNAAELNRHRSGIFSEQVKDLLTMGVDFWREARQKAADRFQSHNMTANTTISEQQPSLTSFTVVSEGGMGYPDSSLTVDDEEDEADSLMSETFPTLMKRQQRLATIFRSSETAFHTSNDVQENKNTMCRSNALESTNRPTLDQTRSSNKQEQELDARASILQDMLSEMYEKNQRLNTTVNELSQINSNLHRQIESKTPDADLLHQVAELEKERNELLQKLAEQHEGASPICVIREGEDEEDKPFDEEAQDVSSTVSVTRSDVAALRAQNKALKQKMQRLKTKKNKQSEKIKYLKSIVEATREDLLVDLSLSESGSISTFSIMNSIMTDSANNDDDDYSSTASSFRRQLASSSEKAAESTKETMERECLITGLASYRFDDFVSRLQQTVQPPKITKKHAESNFANAFETNSVEEICSKAAELYAEHVKECLWRHGELILEWEPPTTIRRIAVDPSAASMKKKSEVIQARPPVMNLPRQERQFMMEEYDRPIPMVIPVQYKVRGAHDDLGSIISCSETSLSSIGMQSLGDNLWI
mgnify:CR=1 FL=1